MRAHELWNRGLHGRAYRLTIPRKAILEVLSNSDDHLSAEDIYITVHNLYPTIGLTTVYRTLDLLVQMGVVFKFDFGDGRARYELMDHFSKKAHHHHLICTSCKTIIDYDDFLDEELDLIHKTENALSDRHNFEIKGHTMQFYGLCDKCSKRL